MSSNASFSIISLANGTEIDLIADPASFQGLGAVRVAGTQIRSGRRPMFALIRTPDGFTMSGYRLVGRSDTPEGTVLDFEMDVVSSGLMEWMVHEVRQRVSLADWTVGPALAEQSRLRLTIRPVERTIGGAEYSGFSYQYEYSSATYPLYQISDRGTWELGGDAVGNEIWMRSSFSPAIVPIDSAELEYTTAWHIPGITNPNAFQFVPLQTEMQGFTLTFSDDGALITWATEVAHIRSVIEKAAGSNEIVHWHEHGGDLGPELTTSPVEVLFAPGSFDRVGRINQYDATRELVEAALHANIGMKRDRVTTYGRIEEWGAADMKRYAELGAPKLTAAGCRTLSIANHFENNMNVWGVKNMCCNVDWKVAERVGEANLKAFCDAAKSGGARVEMWGNTALSTLDVLLDDYDGPDGASTDRIRFLPREGTVREVIRKSSEPWVRNPSGAIEADHYTPLFAVVNLRDPDMRAYWLKCWREAHDDIGIEGLFLDSSFNLSSDKFHWNGGKHQVLSQYVAHLEIIAEMQKFGYKYAGEDIGVFGVHRHGPPVKTRLDNLFIWADCIDDFNVPELLEVGGDPDDIFFRGLAYRLMWTVYWDIEKDRLSWCYGGVRGDFDKPTDRQLALLNIFNDVDTAAASRTTLANETGVVYKSANSEVVWSFVDQAYPVAPGFAACDLLSGSIQSGPTVNLAAQHVYRIEKS